MKLNKTAILFTVSTLFSVTAFAQSTGSGVQRDINQQQRIEQGLKSGELNTKEASRLEGEEARVERMQANALKDGKLSPAKAQRIDHAQNKVSGDIAREKHDAQKGDPNSASSQRMQADVQRNVNQQKRIEQGVQSGQLTNHEAAKLERGQAHDNHLQASAGANGQVGAKEQRRIQRNENRQSRRIHHEKHDRQHQV